MATFWQLDLLAGTGDDPPITVPVGAGYGTTPVVAGQQVLTLLTATCADTPGRRPGSYRITIGDTEIIAAPGATAAGVLDPVTLADLLDVAPHLLHPRRP